MIITRQIKETVSLMFSPAPPEQGGILGMKNGVISAFVLDNSEQKTESAEYSPNTQFLNRQIENGLMKELSFAGFYIVILPDRQLFLARIWSILKSCTMLISGLKKHTSL